MLEPQGLGLGPEVEKEYLLKTPSDTMARIYGTIYQSVLNMNNVVFNSLISYF